MVRIVIGLIIGADRVHIPHVKGDILEVADILARVEIDRDQRIGVEIVAGAQAAIEIGRRVAGEAEAAIIGEVSGKAESAALVRIES